ncbi:MAG: hypothetical protein OEY22_10670 [Candidatus Bathyarchaeota archaeon]|nr:hypothetical protein [Candidatus Bathyarchaeota archaeon]
MSPKTKLFLISVIVAVTITVVMSLMDVPRWAGYFSGAFFAVGISLVLYALLTRILSKLGRRVSHFLN